MRHKIPLLIALALELACVSHALSKDFTSDDVMSAIKPLEEQEKLIEKNPRAAHVNKHILKLMRENLLFENAKLSAFEIAQKYHRPLMKGISDDLPEIHAIIKDDLAAYTALVIDQMPYAVDDGQ